MMTSQYYGLECCRDRTNMKNNITGSNIARNPPKNPIKGWRLHHALIKTSSEN
jgi:hypothetical protein